MPRFQEIGPASTPMLFLENENQRYLQSATDWEENLKRQGLDPESYAKEIQNKQEEIDQQLAEFESRKQMMQQSQKFVDLGIISPEASQKAMWAQVLPKELHEEMYPEPADELRRVPFSPKQIENYQEVIKDFVKLGKKPTRKRFGIDWLARDVYTQKSLLRQYNTWRVNIGYDAMTASQQRQVDNEWDAWVTDKKMKWNPESKEVLAARGKGPLTRGYGSQFRGTPTGPTEAIDPIQSSIATALPKKKPLTQEIVRSLLQETNNNPAEARRLAKERGYTQ